MLSSCWRKAVILDDIGRSKRFIAKIGRAGPNWRAHNHRNRRVDPDVEDSHPLLSSNSDSSSHSNDESTRLSGLSVSFRIVSESLLRMEQTELEMAKAREALRLKAEKQRVKSEAELTQMLLQTQLQIASLVSQQRDLSRKRKRADEEEELSSSLSSMPKRKGTLALSLLQCNLLF